MRLDSHQAHSFVRQVIENRAGQLRAPEQRTYRRARQVDVAAIVAEWGGPPFCAEVPAEAVRSGVDMPMIYRVPLPKKKYQAL